MTGTERKTFQKYYPPDFDPSKIPRAKQSANRQFVQRVMTPCNMQCNTCGEYIYKAKKFNMRRETAMGEDYLGLRIFRFYFRCPNCLAEITFKTDLENVDYKLEEGATRLFEAHKLYQAQIKEEEAKEKEESTNPMKMLEKRTKMSRAEMEELGKLEELREINRREAAIDFNTMLERVKKEEMQRILAQEDEDEAEVQRLFPKKIKDEDAGDEPGSSSSSATPSGSGLSGMAEDLKPPKLIKRLRESSDESGDDEKEIKPGIPLVDSSTGGITSLLLPSTDSTTLGKHSGSTKSKISAVTSSVVNQRNRLKGMVVVKKPKTDSAGSTAVPTTSTSPQKTDSKPKHQSESGNSSSSLTSSAIVGATAIVGGGGGMGLVGAYSSGSSDDDN